MTMESLDVDFSRQASGSEFRGDVPTKHTFEQGYDNYYETFVREVLQNANDAGRDNDDPVRVGFRFDVLTGERLDEFREVINWSKLEEHYRAAIGDDHILRLDEYLTHLAETEEMVVLIVEDYNTIGLEGGEDERAGETPYTSLVRDWQVTYKEGSGAGGSHGVGKSVLWASSGISTVLFNSVPAAQSEDRSPPRLVGRSILPDHYIEDTHHHGKSWIGREDTSDGIGRPVSAWGSEARELASKLDIGRSVDSPGTSILIPGFCSPTGSIRPDLHEVVKDFARAAARNFWPAIYRENLEVVIRRETAEEEKQYDIKKESLDVIPEVAPFVACFEGREEPVDEISEPGDVSTTTLPVEFTPQDADEEIQGEATLCARLKDPGDDVAKDEQEYDLTNRTAIFRGSGMVVDYVSKSEPAVYGDEYYGVLLAGEARLWGDIEGIDPDPETEKAVDEFLTAAEPASHDKWGSTPMLRKKYKRGCVSTAKSLQGERLNRALIELVQSDRNRDGRFVSSVAQHLPDFDQVQTEVPVNGESDEDEDEDNDDDDDTSATLRSDWSWEFEDSQWVFTGTVEPTDEPAGEWCVELSIPKKGEDGATTGYEDVAHLSSSTEGVTTTEEKTEKDGRSDRVGLVTVREDVDEFEFKCRSEQIESFDPFSGHGGETTLAVRREDSGGDN